MQRITLHTLAGQVSSDLALRGIEAAKRVRVTVQVDDDAESTFTLAASNRAGGAFDWLGQEPDLYSDTDIIATTT